MSGDTQFIANLNGKDKIKATIHIDYDYNIVDGLLFMKEAKSLGKSNVDADNAGLKLPTGFGALKVAENVGRARHLTVTPQGNVYVKSSKLVDGKGILEVKINANGKGEVVNFGAYLFGGNVTLQSKSPVIVVTNIGLSQRFLKDKLTLSLYVNDPFTRMMKFTYDAKDPNFTTHSESKMYNRSASFSISWRFGKFNTNN
jgi:hypothetical protein